MKKYALVIGVEEYRDKVISSLRYARNDATALAERLRTRCLFDDVRLLAGDSGNDVPSAHNIVQNLRDIGSEIRGEDLFLFFFAGHGIEKAGQSYLLTCDAIQGMPELNSLSLQLLKERLTTMSAGRRILLLDACRNDPDAGRSDASSALGEVMSRDIVAAVRSRQEMGTSTVLLSACSSRQRAYEWAKKEHGVFTHYLLEGMDAGAWQGSGLDFDSLASYTYKQVLEWSKATPGLPVPQEPWYEKFGNPAPIVLARTWTGFQPGMGETPPARVIGREEMLTDPVFLLDTTPAARIFLLTLVAAGLTMIPLALCVFMPWEPTTKLIVALFFALIYIAVPIFLLQTLLSKRRWMKISHDDELGQKVMRKRQRQASMPTE